MIHSKELEKQLLAVLIQHPKSYGEIANLLGPEDFYVGHQSYVHRTMFKIIKGIQEKGDGDVIDDVILIERLKNANATFRDNADVSEYIRSLMMKPVPESAILAIAKELHSYTVRRALHDNALKVQELASKSNNKNAVEVIESADKIYNSLINTYSASDSHFPIPLYEGLKGTLEDKADNPSPPGFFALDYPLMNSMYGPLLRAGNINIIIARPGVGKTTLTIDYVSKASKENGDIPVLHLDNGEMSADELKLRQVAAVSGINLDLIASGKWRNVSYIDSDGREVSEKEVRRKVYDAATYLEDSKNFHYVNVGGCRPEKMRQIARSHYYNHVGRGNPMMLNFDYIKSGNLGSSGNKQSWELIGEMLQGWKDFVMSEILFDGKPMISMLTSAQANRSAETRGRDQRGYEDSSITGLSDMLNHFASNMFFLRQRLPSEELSEHPFYSKATHRLVNIKPRWFGEDVSRAKNLVMLPALDENGEAVGNQSGEPNCMLLRIDNFGIKEVGDLRDMADRTRFDNTLPNQDGEL